MDIKARGKEAYKALKPHLLPLLVLAVILIAANHPFFSLTNSMREGDVRNSDTPGYVILQNTLIEDGGFPLWDPYIRSGQPLMNPGFPMYYPPIILLSYIFSPYAVLNISVIFHLLLGACFMYFCVWELLKNKQASFIAALIVSMSPFYIRSLWHPFWLYGFAFLPVAFYIVQKAYKSRNPIRWSVLLGIVMALQYLSGGVLQWYWTFFFISGFLAFKIIAKKWPVRIVKSVSIGLIMSIVMFCLIAPAFLFFLEYNEHTNRGVGLPKEEIYRVGHVDSENWFDTFIHTINPKTKAGDNRPGQISVVGFLLMLFGIGYYFAKRKFKEDPLIIYFLIFMLLLIVFATGVFLDQLYEFPGVKAQRDLTRCFIVYIVCAATIAGYAWTYIVEIFRRRRMKDKTIRVVFCILVILLTLNLFYVSWDKLSQRSERFSEHWSIGEQNKVFDYIQADPEVKRFHVVEVSGVDWNDHMGTTIPRELEGVYGKYSPVWDSRYFHTFMAATFRSPAKLWGMLNVKYVLSAQELNNSDYKFVQRFDNVTENTINLRDYETTAYLYANKRFLPRAFFVPSTILVVGNPQPAQQLMYALMLTPEFDPSQVAVIQGKTKINDYSAAELQKYDAVFLTEGSINEQSGFILQQYVASGKKLYPDIIAGKQTLEQSDLTNHLAAVAARNVTGRNVTITEYYVDTPNNMHLKVDNPEESVLFISEKYTLYEGWTATIDGKEAEFMLSNGVLTAMHVPAGATDIHFSYYPPGLAKGMKFLYVGLLLIALGLGYPLLTRFKKKEGETPSEA